MAKNIRRQSNESLTESLTTIGQKPSIQLFKNGAFSITSGEYNFSFDGGTQNKKISVSGTQVSFEEAGTYMAHGSFRSISDVWRKWYVKDSAGNVVGESAWGGSSPNYPNPETWLFTVSAPGVYTFWYSNNGGDSVQLPSPPGGSPGSQNKTLSITVTKVGDL